MPLFNLRPTVQPYGAVCHSMFVCSYKIQICLCAIFHMEKTNLFILLILLLTESPIYFYVFPLESLMLNWDAFKSHSVRKWKPMLCKFVSLESRSKQKEHLADHLFLWFTNYLSSIHFIPIPKHPEIWNGVTDKSGTIYLMPRHYVPHPSLISCLSALCLPKIIQWVFS